MTATVRGRDVRVGDLIPFGGRWHLVRELRPYRHPTLGMTGRTAICEDDWTIVLYDDSRWDIERPESAER